MKRIKIKLIDNWKDGWKFISVNCMWLSAAIQGAWFYLPEDLRSKLPETYAITASIILLIIGIIGRFVDQYLKQPEHVNDNKFPDDKKPTNE